MLKSPLLKKYAAGKGPALKELTLKTLAVGRVIKSWTKKSPSGTGETVNDCEKIK